MDIHYNDIPVIAHDAFELPNLSYYWQFRSLNLSRKIGEYQLKQWIGIYDLFENRIICWLFLQLFSFLHQCTVLTPLSSRNQQLIIITKMPCHDLLDLVLIFWNKKKEFDNEYSVVNYFLIVHNKSVTKKL